MAPVVPVNRGEIWWCDFNPTRGREQNKRRSALIVSVDRLNHGRSGLEVVCPMSSSDPKIPLHVAAPARLTGCSKDLTILCEQVRTVSIERLDPHPAGRVTEQQMALVEERLRLIMGL